MPNSAAEPGGSHRRAIVNYRIRTGAFAYCFGVLGVHAWENNFGPGYWGALVLLFLVYPHVAFLRARYSTDSKRAEEKNLYVDSVMLGAWLTSMQFPMWPLYAALFATTLNATVLSGLRGTVRSLFAFSLGIGVVGLIIYVLIIFFYARYMNALDQEYGVHEGGE